MKKITFRADDDLIDRARLVARSQHKTLNAAFREWLLDFTAQARSGREVDTLMRRLRHVNAGRHFSQDEMNER
jgi:predicted transcriptional regulator